MTISELRSRLALLYIDLDHLDARNQDSLNVFKQELGKLINAIPNDVESERQNLSEHLAQALAKFEAEYPVIARTTEEVVESLSRMGI